MQFKSLKIGYVALIFFLLLAGLASTVHAATTITPSSGFSAQATVGRSYTATITASGGIGINNGQPYDWTATPTTLPLGFTYNITNGASFGDVCTITGPPTAPGNSSFTFRVCDKKNGTCATGSYTITVNPAVSLTPVTNTAISPAAVENTLYTSTTTLTASGGTTPYAWSSSGLSTWGLGLSSTSGNNITITGTPSTGSAGTRTFTVTVTDNWGSTITNTYTLTINSAATCNAGTAGVLNFTIDPNVATANAALQTDATVYCSSGTPFTITASSVGNGSPAATDCYTGTNGILKGTGAAAATPIIYTFKCNVNNSGTNGATGTGLSNPLNLYISASATAANNYENAAVSTTYADTVHLTITY